MFAEQSPVLVVVDRKCDQLREDWNLEVAGAAFVTSCYRGAGVSPAPPIRRALCPFFRLRLL